MRFAQRIVLEIEKSPAQFKIDVNVDNSRPWFIRLFEKSPVDPERYCLMYINGPADLLKA